MAPAFNLSEVSPAEFGRRMQRAEAIMKGVMGKYYGIAGRWVELNRIVTNGEADPDFATEEMKKYVAENEIPAIVMAVAEDVIKAFIQTTEDMGRMIATTCIVGDEEKLKMLLEIVGTDDADEED